MAVASSAAALAGCGTPRPGLSNGSVSACYRAIPAARAVVHEKSATMIGVHRVTADKVRGQLSSNAQMTLAAENDTTVCTVAFKGTFAPGQVDMAPPAAAGPLRPRAGHQPSPARAGRGGARPAPAFPGQTDHLSAPPPRPVIKYIGSKRRLVPVLGELLSRAGAATAIDLFTGTTRVAQEWKRRGAFVTAVDSARYSAVMAECYIATDAGAGRPGRAGPGHFPSADAARNRRVRHRDVQPAGPVLPGTDNARRIDAIRDAIEAEWAEHPWRPILLTALLLASDRVDSTTGLQMAYLKDVVASVVPAPRTAGAGAARPGRARRGAAMPSRPSAGCPRSTSPISTRRTTSTATSATTTCGRP